MKTIGGGSCVLLIEQKIQETRLANCGAMLPQVDPSGFFWLKMAVSQFIKLALSGTLSVVFRYGVT